MIRRFALVFVSLALIAGGIRLAMAAAFPLSDGTSLDGDPISYNAIGVVVKKADGTFAPRMGWTNFTQEAIKQFAKDPKAKAFVEPYLEADESEAEKKPSLEIKPKAHPRLERPNPKAGMGAMFSSSVTVVLFLLLYAGNIYAAFEIAIFRNYHPGLVCGIAAAAPVIGPVIFLCLPPRVIKSHEELAAEAMAEHAPEAPQLAYAHPGGYDPNATGEDVAAAAAAAVAAAQPKVTTYVRGQTSFNRRFFESKFAGFLKVVPGEATADVIIPFTEIYEIQVRPKDA